MPESDFEKMGVFYLGRRYDLAADKTLPELVLYDSRDLVTHAVCIGMTGSGKTGLCLSVIEEAAIDGIPVIAIDPKGDIGNLLLTFPDLNATTLEPWVSAEEARRQAISTQQLAEREAQTWLQGLQEWEEVPARIERLKQATGMTIYTPGSTAGVPISIIRSFATPPQAVLDDGDALLDRVSSTTSSLLGLLAMHADPLRSREHILISNILLSQWQAGKDLSLIALIQLIQKPPFGQIGALDVEAFYPAKERFELAMSLNNLIASPGFGAWTEGEALDIDRILFSESGKPQVAIFSIAHLDDNQRMFFVSLLLNQLIAWMRAQSGTSSLRALLYMDEIFGYFPPTANPPSKTPLLTLMKQARAFGLGVMLATQNPVDIDYKGLANAGTWFIGRLQTERDKMRVLDGLEGAAADAGSQFDRGAMDKLLSRLGSRVFLMNDVHAGTPIVFKTRWTLSYLKGPLSKDDIRRLVASSKNATKSGAMSSSATPHPSAVTAPAAVPPVNATAASTRPLLPPDVKEFFLPLRQSVGAGSRLWYKPFIYAVGNVRFTNTRASVDTTLQYNVLGTPPESGLPGIDWATAEPAKVWMEQLQQTPEPQAEFAPLPAGLTNAKSYAAWTKEFATWLYNTKKLKLLKCELTGDFSRPRESERDFRIRLSQSAREQRDKEAAALKARYAPKLAALEQRLRRAQQSLERQQMQARDQQLQSAISVGATVLGAFMSGGRISGRTVDRAATAARRAGRAAKEQQDVAQASDTVQSVSEQLNKLNSEFAAEMSALEGKFDPLKVKLSEIVVAPKKTNIIVPLLTLAWAPIVCDVAGHEKRAWLATDSAS